MIFVLCAISLEGGELSWGNVFALDYVLKGLFAHAIMSRCLLSVILIGMTSEMVSNRNKHSFCRLLK